MITLLLAAALLFSLCAPAMAETTTVKFWTHQNNAWNEDWQRIIDEFEAVNPDIKIE